MKSWPVLVGIAVVGSLCGVVIAGRDEPVGTVTAAPLLIEVGPATISSTSTPTSAIDTSGGGATLGSTSTSIVQSSPVVPSLGSTSTTIVLSSPVVPSPGSTTTTVDVSSPGSTTTTTIITTTIVLSSPVGPTPAATDAGNGGPPDTERTPLRLVVAGADGRTGLADATAARLSALGYGNVRIARAAAPVQFTIIYFRSGFNRQAVTVATDLQADDPILEEWTLDAANPLTDADATGDVIVLLGSDAPG